ncbi:ABC transporter permease [Jiangella endophytica]|uniref:ABC transporter permease n=1 Tax=Jiangella endophytica TaxID=1623398 RepID=UPI000E357748|nr:ABC transporter permease [Jiangella endophytica]
MRALRSAVRLRAAKIALAVLGVVVVLMVAGEWLAPYDPLHQDTTAILAGPSAEHWLGTDYVGRDVLSRLLAGSRLSVIAAAEAVGLGLLLGVLPGLASVYFGPVFEWLSLRVMDGLMALPFIIFAIAVAALLGNGLHQAMFAVGVLMAPSFYRVTRAAAIGLRQAQYVEAATLFGATRWRVVRTHVWQKVLPTVVVTTATAMAGALLVVSSLTFLGIGVQPPAPTWGGMLASDLGYLTQRPFGPVAPALLIIVTVAALNALADAIRDATGDGAPASSVPAPQEVLDDVPAARV